MMENITSIVRKNLAGFLLILILSGFNPDMSRFPVDELELKYMSGAVMIENGNQTGQTPEEKLNDIYRILYTASVIENRKNSNTWKGSTTEEVIMAKEGPYWQYASVTRDGFKTKEYSKTVETCCHYVLYFGSILPENVVYQGQGKNGSGVYKSIPVRGDKDELFCYE